MCHLCSRGRESWPRVAHSPGDLSLWDKQWWQFLTRVAAYCFDVNGGENYTARGRIGTILRSSLRRVKCEGTMEICWFFSSLKPHVMYCIWITHTPMQSGRLRSYPCNWLFQVGAHVKLTCKEAPIQSGHQNMTKPDMYFLKVKTNAIPWTFLCV